MHHYAIFSARYAPLVGGVERYTEELARVIREAGDKVEIVTSAVADKPMGLESKIERVWRLPAHMLLGGRLPISAKNGSYCAVMSELKEQGIDRVVVNTRFYRHSLEGLRFADAIGAKALVIDHGSNYLTLGNVAVDATIRAYEHHMTTKVKYFKPTFAGVSAMSCTWLETFGIKTDVVVPNAIDATRFIESAAQINWRQKCKISADSKLVAFVGRMTVEKGIDALVEAACLMPDATFICAGDGALSENIASKQLKNVVLTGAINHDQLSSLLQQADVFCLPSRSEGFCTALLEAGVCGCVPVVPHVGGADEVKAAQFGVELKDCTPQTIVSALKEAFATRLTVENKTAFKEYVTSHCSWEYTRECLENAFA